MRPLKLVMTGFESYKDKTEINFEKLGSKGLYLITGDTGAGKTTIFDAITFALYGSPSGTDRSVEMLRSHFADADTPTVVELEFEASGKKYHITRNPDYERKALRGEGTTKEAANALLEYVTENREPVSGVSKVNAEIETILKLKKEQFCRIAMIAQGRFQELLLSKKDAKQEIFRELFHTEKYERLQDVLKADKSQANSYLSDLKIKLQEALNRIDVCEADEDFEKVNQIKISQYITEDEILILKIFVEKDEKVLSEVLKQIDEVESKLEKVNSELQIGETRQKLEEQITESENLQKEKNTLITKLNVKLTLAEKEAEKIPDLEKEKTLLEDSLKDYEEISKAETSLEKLEAEISGDEKTLSLSESEKLKLEAQLQELQKELSALKNAGEKIGTLEAALEKISDEQDAMEEIIEQISKLGEDKESLTIAQGKLQKAMSDFEKSNHTYSEKVRLFNLEQAGILAEGLMAGCACPVCGSTEHPHLACKSDKAPSQQEIENLKNQTDELQKKSSELSVNAGQMKTAVEKSEESINKLLKKYFENLTVTDEQVAEKIKTRNCELESEAKQTEDKLNQERKDKIRREQIEKQIPETDEKVKAVTSEIAQLAAKISGAKAKHDSESKALLEKKSGLKYETLKEAQMNFAGLAKQINELKEKVDTAKQNKTECEMEIKKLSGAVEGLKVQLEKTKPVDIEKLTKEKLELVDLKDGLNEQRDSMNERKGVNQESVVSIEKLVPEITAATKRYDMISALSEVASGTNKGKKGKPSLETYVQMNCLDQINRRANLRLKKMTDNKYELHRHTEEDGSELGLDLDVKDFYTGRKRNVQTLSGGEQFQASLALALGLADEVQENSGGIKLDTMFIDEGFGTLDSETLNKAMHALEDLSQGNKLIGIISHVEELESRIDNKIVVTKNSSGISNAVIKKD